MDIKAEQVQKLREKTGLGMMDVRNALVQAEGNEEEAIKILEEKAGAKLEKRADRATSQGRVGVYSHMNNKLGVMIELQCETDFVADSEDFVAAVKDMCLHAAFTKPASVEELLEQDFVKDSSKKIADIVRDLSAKTGENVRLAKVAVFELGS